MRELAKDRGGKCLSDNYVNNKTPLKWECELGHQWETKPNNVMRGTWCPKCAGTGRSLKYTIKDMQKFAKKREGMCLSHEFKGRMRKLEWQCKESHQWEATPNNVIRGTWCPRCAVIKRKKKLKIINRK